MRPDIAALLQKLEEYTLPKEPPEKDEHPPKMVTLDKPTQMPYHTS